LDAELAKHDLVISLIPYTFHATVIKSAIRQKKHVVTTSYVSPAMLELDQQCKDAGITVMNEIGLGMFLFTNLFLISIANWLTFLQIQESITYVRIYGGYETSIQY
jgi:saccharopine dehydrogenase-like NADP-dependent oxidoreductase